MDDDYCSFCSGRIDESEYCDKGYIDEDCKKCIHSIECPNCKTNYCVIKHNREREEELDNIIKAANNRSMGYGG